MFKFLWKLGTAYDHSRGLFALDAGRFVRAEHFLRQAILKGERVSSPLLGETYLLLSATLEALKRRTDAMELFWTGILEVEQSPDYSIHDVNYLGTYFCQLLKIADCQRFQGFDITAVRRSLRRDFPMSLNKGHRIS